MPRDAPGGAVSLSRCARRIRFPYGALRLGPCIGCSSVSKTEDEGSTPSGPAK